MNTGETLSIWVDADACPKVIKEILYRAAERTGVTITFVANQALAVPRFPSLRVLQVAHGFDVADNEIVRRAAAGDSRHHRRHPARGRGDGEGRASAESARRALFA